MINEINFVNPEQAGYFSTLRKRVDSYFANNSISKFGNGFMAFKIFFFLSGLAGSYLLLILAHFSFPITLILWILVGFFTAFTGVNIGHDAIHGSISKNKNVNKLFGYTFNLAGANAYLWSIMHNKSHHTHTNIQGFDEDLDVSPLLRLSPHQKLRKIHRYQHWYGMFLYTLTSLSWVFIKDYRKIAQNKIGNYDTSSHPVSEHFILFFSKLVYYILFLMLPFLLLDMPWWLILIGFLSMHFVEGFTLAIIITLSHVVEGPQFPMPDQDGNIHNAWAVHQMYTTTDYARKKPLTTFFCGGLNFHIEHHLFPHICHVHYPALSTIVEKTAKEFNIPYMELPSMGSAMVSHLKFLKKFGRQENPLPGTVLESAYPQ